VIEQDSRGFWAAIAALEMLAACSATLFAVRLELKDSIELSSDGGESSV